MFGRLVSMIIGFVLASLFAGLTKVLFVHTPQALVEMNNDQITNVLWLALFVAIASAKFAAPFALIGGAIGEWRRIRDWSFYVLLGIAISVVGFMAQYNSETSGAPTIVNNYALTAFLVTGFVGGLVYWMVTGRNAGGRDYVAPPSRQRSIEVMPPAKSNTGS